MCFFKIKKVHLLVSELYIYQNARRNNKRRDKILIVIIYSLLYSSTQRRA